MVTHSRILAWRIPWTEEPGRLQSSGSQESDRTQRLNHHHIYIYIYINGITFLYAGNQRSTINQLVAKGQTQLSTHTEYKPFDSNFLLCYQIWGPAACCSKVNTKEVRLVERKVCFIKFALFQKLANGEEDGLMSKGQLSPDNQRQEFLNGSFKSLLVEGRGYMQKRHSPLWQPS